MTTTDQELTHELLRTARFVAVGAIELQVRERIRVLREEQQTALLSLIEGGHHRRPEESPTNKVFEAQIGELEEVISTISFYKESLFVDVDPEEDPSDVDTSYTETAL